MEQIKKNKGTPIKHAVLILVNHDVVIYNFRAELVEQLLADGYEVHISSPYGERIGDLIALGAVYHELIIDRHGMNPVEEAGILCSYRRLMKKIKPLAVLAYTIKPDIYGGIAAREAQIPFIANITGLGIGIQNGRVKRWFILKLYKVGLYKARKVFFQNKEDQHFMLHHNIVSSPYELLPGSGVNLTVHRFEPYPADSSRLIFTTIGRIMKDKGTDELLEAARVIKRRHPKVKFRMIGFFDDDYKDVVDSAVKEGIIQYMGQKRDIHPYIAESHAIIHPSYHEGMSNVLLEAAATGRPVIASNVAGCREIFVEGISGLGFKAHSSNELIKAIEAFIALPYEQKVSFGQAGRRKMEREFNRQTVIKKYMKEISSIAEEKERVYRTLS